MEDLVLVEIVRRLVETYRPEQIYLFGSHARGDAGPDSDFDVVVIVPDHAPAERRRSRLAYQVLWGVGAAADVLVWPARASTNGVDWRAHSRPPCWRKDACCMNNDEVKQADVQAWLRKAGLDLRAAEVAPSIPDVREGCVRSAAPAVPYPSGKRHRQFRRSS